MLTVENVLKQFEIVVFFSFKITIDLIFLLIILSNVLYTNDLDSRNRKG